MTFDEQCVARLESEYQMKSAAAWRLLRIFRARKRYSSWAEVTFTQPRLKKLATWWAKRYA